MSEPRPPRINDSTVLIGMLEDGELSRDLSKAIKEAIAKTREAAGARSSGSCSVTLTIGMKVDGGIVEFTTDIASKTPKASRGKTFFFLNGEGEITTENPQRPSMFPEDAASRYRA